MSFEQIINSMIAISPFFVLKIFILIGLVFYLIFALVVFRQVKLMLEVIGGTSPNGLSFIAVVHLLAVAVLFICALILL